MKKYVTATHDGNRKQVIDALENVGLDGLKARRAGDGIIFISVNSESEGVLGWGGSSEFYTAMGNTLLDASYVIEHAADLDGAKKPGEIAEEGRRFVTEDEKENNKCPTCSRFFGAMTQNWQDADISGRWGTVPYTVPLCYVFPSEENQETQVIEVRVPSACQGLVEVRVPKGCTVNIIEEK